MTSKLTSDARWQCSEFKIGKAGSKNTQEPRPRYSLGLVYRREPKGTIHGLGFKDVETAEASVRKIKASDRTHAHKIQAAIAMEQRAKVMKKTAEAAVYRKFIEEMKKKTKEMNEEAYLPGQATTSMVVRVVVVASRD